MEEDYSNYARAITDLHAQLGIPADYASQFGLDLCPECGQPVPIGQDVFGREQAMAPQAANAWFAMRDDAAADDIALLVVSAYRALAYQAGIIQGKLDKGQTIEDILKVSAAPGYSEPHSGRALDLTTPGFEPLEEEFENSPAFAWLTENAARHGFRMSVPRNNPFGVAYEPWHWCWVG